MVTTAARMACRPPSTGASGLVLPTSSGILSAACLIRPNDTLEMPSASPARWLPTDHRPASLPAAVGVAGVDVTVPAAAAPTTLGFADARAIASSLLLLPNHSHSGLLCYVFVC
jgi:hypothetical protein